MLSTPSSRFTVSCNIVDSPLTSGNNCFGYIDTEAGQSRVPAPPESMIGRIVVICSF